MKKTISEIAHIRFGLYSQPTLSGDVAYLQARHFNEQGRMITKPDEFVKLDVREESHLLKDGDILFVGKGSRMFAWCYRESSGPCIASSIFFVIRPKNKLVHPEYLATILNTRRSRANFQQVGSGTNILSIRKSELGAFEIPLLSLDEQQQIAELSEMHQQEIFITKQLITLKEKLYAGIISKLIQ